MNFSGYYYYIRSTFAESTCAGRCASMSNFGPPPRVYIYIETLEKSNSAAAYYIFWSVPTLHLFGEHGSMLISTRRGMPAASADHCKDAIWPRPKVSCAAGVFGRCPASVETPPLLRTYTTLRDDAGRVPPSTTISMSRDFRFITPNITLTLRAGWYYFDQNVKVCLCFWGFFFIFL